MATPDFTLDTYETPLVTVEVAGDYVHLSLADRHGEPIILFQMTADEADALAAKLWDAVCAIDTRVPAADTSAADWRDAADRAETPNPTFNQAVDALFDAAAPRMAASA